MTHGELLGLIFVSNLLFGLLAPIAGWLGDRWSFTNMMGLFFAGTGASMIITGLSYPYWGMILALALVGTFASIYHPVGIPWLINNTQKSGKALGINGFFGGIGPAVGTLIAGGMIHLYGWRIAFGVTGGLILATSLVFYYFRAKCYIIEGEKIPARLKHVLPASGLGLLGITVILLITILGTGFIYQATLSILPKMFSEDTYIMANIKANIDILGLSAVISSVYVIASFFQILVGMAADRYPLKTVYILCFLLQVPLLSIAGMIEGIGLVLAVIFMITLNLGTLPIEHLMVAHYSPHKRRALIFGLKSTVTFAIGSLGVVVGGALFDLTGGFFLVFTLLAIVAAISTAASLLLPSGQLKTDISYSK